MRDLPPVGAVFGPHTAAFHAIVVPSRTSDTAVFPQACGDIVTTPTIQRSLDFAPPVIRVAVPPHNPALVRKLKPATLNVLGLLGDGLPHNRLELAKVGGNRYAARVGELRDAGHRVLGPSKSKKHELWETEPMRDGLECYRLALDGGR